MTPADPPLHARLLASVCKHLIPSQGDDRLVPDAIMASTRGQWRVARARRLAMYIHYETTKPTPSWTAVGRAFGRDRKTAREAHSAIRGQLAHPLVQYDLRRTIQAICDDLTKKA